VTDIGRHSETAPPRGATAAVCVWRLRRFRRHRGGMASPIVLLLVVLFSLAAYPLETYLGIDSNATDLLSRYDAPSALHWLGTDEGGRDELLRLMYGGQISLLIGLLATVFGGMIGVSLGLIAGHFGGGLDSLLIRLVDGVITLPLLPLLIVLAAVDLTKLGFSSEFAHSGAAGFWRVVVIIAVFDWTAVARLVPAATLSVKERDYVLAARASGAGVLSDGRTYPAEHRHADDRRLHADGGTRDPVRIGAELSRLRHRAADVELGQYAQ
jgi:peptide/nickel transport system permease protein